VFDHPMSDEASSSIDEAIETTTSRALVERGSQTAKNVGAFAKRVVAKVRPAHSPDEIAPDDWRWLRRPGLLGFIALVAIAVGSSFSNSPFKLEMPGTWFFGVPTANTAATDHGNQTLLMLGLVLVYGGLVLLLRVWIQLGKALKARPGAPIKALVWILVLWVIPMMVIAPIFSRDVFSYAAQGEMVSHHISPYIYGPFTLGSGPYVNPVDPLWGNTPAPYGPLFMIIDGFFASATFHHATVTVLVLRILELAAVALLAYCIPKLARSFNRDAGEAFVLAVLNPIVVLTLIGGAHNDALMVALLVAGLTAARLKHPVWGVILCALAAAVKAPAALGILYIGWEWLGTGIPLRQRLRPIAISGLIAAAVLGALTLLSGLGLGWVGNLLTPGTVKSWDAPATAIGMALTGLGHVVGIGVAQASVLSVTRMIGLGLSIVVGIWLLKESDRIGELNAIGLTLLLFVVLGPVVQPWYLTWGLVLLAPVAEGRIRTTLIVLSVVSPFVGLPGGRELLTQLVHIDPISLALTLAALLIFVVAPLGKWTAIGQRTESTSELVSTT
jgi:alpha-1,6-mannosyltransferase